MSPFFFFLTSSSSLPGVITTTQVGPLRGERQGYIIKIHFVEREGMKFEKNRLHLSRQDELLVMWAALIRFSIQLFFSRVAGLDVLILYVFSL